VAGVRGVGAGELNYQGFLIDLARLVGAPAPDPATGDPARDAYVFERPVRIERPDGTATTNFIGLYKRGCFVLEARQGSDARPKLDRETPPDLFAPGPATGRRRGTAVRGAIARTFKGRRTAAIREALEEWRETDVAV